MSYFEGFHVEFFRGSDAEPIRLQGERFRATRSVATKWIQMVAFGGLTNHPRQVPARGTGSSLQGRCMEGDSSQCELEDVVGRREGGLNMIELC